MTRVAMHVAVASPAATPIETYRTRLAAAWDKQSRFEAAAGHHLLAEADSCIAEDFREGRSDPPKLLPMEHSPSALRY